jgi:hypothetical protein
VTLGSGAARAFDRFPTISSRPYPSSRSGTRLPGVIALIIREDHRGWSSVDREGDFPPPLAVRDVYAYADHPLGRPRILAHPILYPADRSVRTDDPYSAGSGALLHGPGDGRARRAIAGVNRSVLQRAGKLLAVPVYDSSPGDHSRPALSYCQVPMRPACRAAHVAPQWSPPSARSGLFVSRARGRAAPGSRARPNGARSRPGTQDDAGGYPHRCDRRAPSSRISRPSALQQGDSRDPHDAFAQHLVDRSAPAGVSAR